MHHRVLNSDLLRVVGKVDLTILQESQWIQWPLVCVKPTYLLLGSQQCLKDRLSQRKRISKSQHCLFKWSNVHNTFIHIHNLGTVAEFEPEPFRIKGTKASHVTNCTILRYHFNSCQGKLFWPGPDPIKISQHKFYAMLFVKHSDWILNIFNQNAGKIA